MGRTRALACGDPMDEEIVVGPLIEPVHVERVLSWIAEARAAGAKLHCGSEADGQVVQPTSVEPFDTFEQALAACNAGRFGLQAGVFTRDVGRALLAFRDLDYGDVLINDIPTFRVDNFPYGGTKDSGFGRERIRFAMDEMSEPKALLMRGPAGLGPLTTRYPDK